jgi:hypothetical protein
MTTESENAVAEMKALSLDELKREYEGFNEYVQKSLILFNAFTWRADKVSQYLAAELPELIDSYEQWRSVNREWIETGSRLAQHLGSVIEIGLKDGDKLFEFWRILAEAFPKSAKGNE